MATSVPLPTAMPTSAFVMCSKWNAGWGIRAGQLTEAWQGLPRVFTPPPASARLLMHAVSELNPSTPACASAGESFTPSPTIAAPPAPGRCCSSRILATLPAGMTSAAFTGGTAVERKGNGHQAAPPLNRQLLRNLLEPKPSSTTQPLPSGQPTCHLGNAQLAGDGPSGAPVVPSQQHGSQALRHERAHHAAAGRAWQGFTGY